MPERRLCGRPPPSIPVADQNLQTDVTDTTVPEPVPAPQNGVPTDASIAGTMIVFDGVTKVYDPNVIALNDVSFVIEKGEFVFVVGASGSGKSTMIRLLLKELEPSSGRILVGGRDLTRLKHSKVPLLRRNVGCVFQDFKLLPNRTAAENVAYALKVQGDSNANIRRKRSTANDLFWVAMREAQGAGGALARWPLGQGELAARRALGRRAAARLDRACSRQPPAAPDL